MGKYKFPITPQFNTVVQFFFFPPSPRFFVFFLFWVLCYLFVYFALDLDI